MPPDHNSQPKKSLIFANYYLHAMDLVKKQRRRMPSASHMLSSFTSIWNQRSLLKQNRCSWMPAQSVLYCCNSQIRLKEFYAVQLTSHKATFQIYFKSFIWNVFKIYYFILIWNKSKQTNPRLKKFSLMGQYMTWLDWKHILVKTIQKRHFENQVKPS